MSAAEKSVKTSSTDSGSSQKESQYGSFAGISYRSAGTKSEIKLDSSLGRRDGERGRETGMYGFFRESKDAFLEGQLAVSGTHSRGREGRRLFKLVGFGARFGSLKMLRGWIRRDDG